MLGISPDAVESHRRFRDRLKLPFQLLADTDHAVAEAYGVWHRTGVLGLGIDAVQRTTFILDVTGRIAHVIRKANPFAHAERARDVVASLT